MQDKETKKTTMSVMDMGRLLGLKKVESYWLAHKGYFDIITVNGKMRVVTDSFESWYTRQTRYHKVSGEPPGSQLAEESWSVRDIADMLGLSESTAYSLVARAGMETVMANGWMRIPKDTFQAWYESQSRYRITEDREKEASLKETTMSMPDMARLLDVPRGTVYSILNSRRGKQFLEIIELAGEKRITKDSFELWYRSQDRYVKEAERSDEGKDIRKHYRDCLSTQDKNGQNHPKMRVSANKDYLTIDEAAAKAGITRQMVNLWIRRGDIRAHRLSARISLIPREEFVDFLSVRRKQKEGITNGRNHKKR